MSGKDWDRGRGGESIIISIETSWLTTNCFVCGWYEYLLSHTRTHAFIHTYSNARTRTHFFTHTPRLSRIHTLFHAHIRTNFHTHAHTHTHTHTLQIFHCRAPVKKASVHPCFRLSLAVSPSLSFLLSLSHTIFCSLVCWVFLSRLHTRIHIHFLSLCLSLSLSLPVWRKCGLKQQPEIALKAARFSSAHVQAHYVCPLSCSARARLHQHTKTDTHINSFTFARTGTHIQSLSNTQTYTRPHKLAHTCTHIHTISLTHTHTLTPTRKITHTQTFGFTPFNFPGSALLFPGQKESWSVRRNYGVDPWDLDWKVCLLMRMMHMYVVIPSDCLI